MLFLPMPCTVLMSDTPSLLLTHPLAECNDLLQR